MGPARLAVATRGQECQFLGQGEALNGNSRLIGAFERRCNGDLFTIDNDDK